MSRIGRQPVAIPAGVSVRVVAGSVTVQGPKGTLSQQVMPSLGVSVDGATVVISRADDQPQTRAYHGLTRALVANMVTGVSRGWEKRLEVQGTGYRAEVKGRTLTLFLGYSHPVEFPVPAGVDIAVDKGGKITVAGADRQQVGQVAAVIRGFREPDHYKGKGVRYEGERVRIKQGKKA